MGRTSSNGAVIAYIPGARGQAPDTVGAVQLRNGESVNDALARGGITRRTGMKLMTLSGEDLQAAGGRRNLRDIDITDFTGNNLGRRLVGEQTAANAGVANRRVGREAVPTRRARDLAAAPGTAAKLRSQLNTAQRERRKIVAATEGMSAATRRRRLSGAGVTDAQIADLRARLGRANARAKG